MHLCEAASPRLEGAIMTSEFGDVESKITAEQRAEIDQLRATANSTKRATVEALEELLFEAFPVLDHGFVRVVDYMGDDAAIVQAARVSYGQGTRRLREDAGLIRYLMRNSHSTPFEMCEIKLHVKLPIFVARQWIRHRTANVNEYSARYSIMDREFYIPDPGELGTQSITNRQGQGEPLTGSEAERVLGILREDAVTAYSHYEEMLNEDARGTILDDKKRGLARELARMNLSLNFYTQWYWKIDLHNLLHFLVLRRDDHAQHEIRAYADLILGIVEKWVPLTYEAFKDYRLDAAQLSGKGLVVLRKMLDGEHIVQSDSGMSGAEWRDLMAVLGRSS